MNQTMGQRHEPARIARLAGFARLPSADGSGLVELLRLAGADPGDARLGVDIPVPVRRVQEGQSLFLEGARAQAIYFVRGGTFKTFCTGEDGYEQVLGFSGRGELLGVEAIGSGQFPNQAVALEDSSVFVLMLADYFGAGPRNPALDRMVFAAVSDAMQRRGELADVMAAVAAEVRLARFLMHLSRRLAASGQSPRRFHLRMGRRDIASYLGVAHETVSRSFGTLVDAGLLRIDNREVEILDVEELRAFSSGTRRRTDERSRAAPARACLSPVTMSASRSAMAA